MRIPASSIAEAMERVLTDPSFRERLRAQTSKTLEEVGIRLSERQLSLLTGASATSRPPDSEWGLMA